MFKFECCPSCESMGFFKMYKGEKCYACKGTGYIWEADKWSDEDRDGVPTPIQTPCVVCGGSGTFQEEHFRCNDCGAKFKHPASKTLEKK